MTTYKSNQGKGYFVLSYKFVKPIYFQYLENLERTLNNCFNSFIVLSTEATQTKFAEYVKRITESIGNIYTAVIYTDLPEAELTELIKFLKEFETQTGIEVFLACSEERVD